MKILQSDAQRDIKEMIKLLEKASKCLDKSLELYVEHEDFLKEIIQDEKDPLTISDVSSFIRSLAEDMSMQMQEKKSAEMSERVSKKVSFNTP